jgi:hypothetical protein
MFKMGGPIKEGVMHGIREPYRGGGAALVGNPVYPQTGGREHHNIVYQTGARLAPVASKVFGKVGNIFKGTPTVGGGIGKHSYQATRMAPLSKLEKIKSWFSTAPAGKYLAGSPEGKLLSGAPGKIGWAGRKVGSAAKGLAKSPLTVGAGLIYGVPWGYNKLTGEKETDPPTGVPLNPNLQKKKKLSAAAKKEFALKQREDRVNRYLELMGYDRAKKTAIADALID